MRLSGLLVPMFVILFPYLLFEYLRSGSLLDEKYVTPTGHFYIVSFVAILSTIIAVAVGAAGNRLRNIKVSFLSLAFVSLAEIFAVHGLSTPDFLIHTTHLPSIASQLSILLATIWLWLSSLSSDHFLVAYLARWKSSIVPIWAAFLALFGIVGMLYPDTFNFIPLDGALKWTLTSIIFLLNAVTIYHYYQSYRYSRFPLQIAIVYSTGWLFVAQVIMAFGEPWRVSWWLYHFLLLASMVVMLVGLIQQYIANKSLLKGLRALFSSDPVERISSSLSPSVKALILATETRDAYTAGHNFRVAMYALKLAEQLQLSPEQLRAVAQGGVVHDVGKINIADSILNKPGRLTDEERAIIESHPVTGYEMCRRLGFLSEELGIIRSHHERWDGNGYPDGLHGEEIPLLARIVAVADVYDAVTSNRSYRQAWTHDAAMKLLNEQKGIHFDPACVEAWEQICARDPQVYQYPASTITDAKSFPGVYQPPETSLGK